MSNQESRYGLSEQDLSNAILKVAKQKNYLESKTFITNFGEVKSFLDFSYSANNSERYYSRILNKVDTFVSTSLSRDLVPLFLTVTADGFFRRFMKGDYSEWTPELRESYKKSIPNNDRNGFYLDYLDGHNTLTPKDVYKIISHQLRRFYNCETLRNIKKDGFRYTSIRVTEPHKDGVPHFHILMYIPKDYIPSLYEEFYNFFPAPRNRQRLTYRNTTGKHRRDGEYICDMLLERNDNLKTFKMYETFGFQTQIRSAAGYILKYLLKSFKNLIEDKELDYLQAWYVHNKIPRIITTHTLVSQTVYHKVAMIEPCWYYLTHVKRSGGLTVDTLNDYFRFEDETGRTILHDNGFFMLSLDKKILFTYGKKKFFIQKVRMRGLTWSASKPKNFKILRIYEIYRTHKEYIYYINTNFKDGTLLSFANSSDFSVTHIYELGISMDADGEFQGFSDVFGFDTMQDIGHTPVSLLSDLDAFDQYQTFDFDMYVPGRYAILKNSLIDRGLLREEKVNPNDFNSSFYD